MTTPHPLLQPSVTWGGGSQARFSLARAHGGENGAFGSLYGNDVRF